MDGGLLAVGAAIKESHKGEEKIYKEILNFR
jgi:hypothetical protein